MAKPIDKPLDKVQKLELIQRSLGLRHKLKVHESMKQPETHEDIAIMLLAKWEYEDELRAIEDILGEGRALNTLEKRESVLRDGVKLKRSPHLGEDDHASLPNRSGSTQKKTSKK